MVKNAVHPGWTQRVQQPRVRRDRRMSTHSGVTSMAHGYEYVDNGQESTDNELMSMDKQADVPDKRLMSTDKWRLSTDERLVSVDSWSLGFLGSAA